MSQEHDGGLTLVVLACIWFPIISRTVLQTPVSCDQPPVGHVNTTWNGGQTDGQEELW